MMVGFERESSMLEATSRSIEPQPPKNAILQQLLDVTSTSSAHHRVLTLSVIYKQGLEVISS